MKTSSKTKGDNVVPLAPANDTVVDTPTEVQTAPVSEGEGNGAAAIPAGPQRKVWVVYIFSTGAGATSYGSIFVNGIADIRSQNEIEELHRLIAEQTKATFVQIINWKSLEA